MFNKATWKAAGKYIFYPLFLAFLLLVSYYIALGIFDGIDYQSEAYTAALEISRQHVVQKSEYARDQRDYANDVSDQNSEWIQANTKARRANSKWIEQNNKLRDRIAELEKENQKLKSDQDKYSQSSVKLAEYQKNYTNEYVKFLLNDLEDTVLGIIPNESTTWHTADIRRAEQFADRLPYVYGKILCEDLETYINQNLISSYGSTCVGVMNKSF